MLAATGLAATVAAAGMAAAPAGAATSGKLYACYSDKTKALYYSKPGAKCAKGFTQISWNKQGPQGPQGARGAQGTQGHQGAQGAQGAVAGYTKDAENGPFSLPSGASPMTVASVIPTVAASYAIDAMAVGTPGAGGDIVCIDKAVSSKGTSVASTAEASTKFNGPATLATNGILHGGPASPIKEVCKTLDTTKSGKVTRAQLTAVQLSTAHTESKPVRRPRNQISSPRPPRTR